jgi:glycosyltransferase involved in cell wall biosynthesis
MLTKILFRVVDRISIGILRLSMHVGRRLTAHRLARGKPRTLWGVTPILTLPLKARCDRALGFESESFVYTTYIITQAFDVNFSSISAMIYKLKYRYGVDLHRLVLAWALLRYDVFNYFADRGIMPSPRRLGIDPGEMDAVRASGKRLYVYCYGADVRTREKTLALGRWNFCSDCPEPGKFCICDDATGAEVIAEIAERANAIVSLGDMLVYAPGCRHLAYWPIDTQQVRYVGTKVASGPLRIAHAPNHTHFKGTAYLDQAVARLRDRGYALELVTVSGVPNKKVMELFAEVDLVADQFIGGAYGYTALEALACGKPVLTYIRDSSLVVAADECPFLIVRPETIEQALEWCLNNRARLPAIGAQGRAYVERWHSIPAVASRFAAMYRETADFPATINERLATFIERETDRRRTVHQSEGWSHPWQILRQHADDDLMNSSCLN